MKTAPTKRKPRTEHSGNSLPLDTSLFAPGDRVCVAVSGGADSIALLRCLLARREELGIVLSVVHVEHGLRGQSSVRDAEFVAELAKQFDIPCEVVAVDTLQRAAERKESVETAARALRYGAFRQVLQSGCADAVATAHTLDDQAETVLMKLLRGAWTEGLSGIHPVLQWGKIQGENGRNDQVRGARCVRPFLAVRRLEIEEYLRTLGQPWREDESNDSFVHTRNRIRHELLPLLRSYNPQVEKTLGHVAANARAEERHWQAELDRVLPLLLLPGKPARGGGRSVSTALGETVVAMEIARLKDLEPGLLRRVLRAAVDRLGVELDFDATERLLSLVDPRLSGFLPGKQTGKRLELSGGVRVERSARELRLERRQDNAHPIAQRDPDLPSSARTVEYELPVPGTVDAPLFGSSFTATIVAEGRKCTDTEISADRFPSARIRTWQPGDRIELRHSRGPKKVKEVLNQMRVAGEERALWPVIVWQGRIVWMRGASLPPAATQGNARMSVEEGDGSSWILEIHENPKLP